MPRNPELLRELNLKCTSAIDKFDNFKDVVIPIAFIEDWLKSNEELKIKTSLRPGGPPGVITFFETEEDYQVTYADINRFYRLYESFIELNEYRVFEPNAKEALNELRNLSNAEDALKEWLEKYKQLGSNDLILFSHYHLGEDSNSYPSVVDFDCDIERTPFENIIEFINKFNGLYFIPDAIE